MKKEKVLVLGPESKTNYVVVKDSVAKNRNIHSIFLYAQRRRPITIAIF